MCEYWNRPDATGSAFTADGWFCSGDVGVRDDEGYITVFDRLKDMIISAARTSIRPRSKRQFTNYRERSSARYSVSPTTNEARLAVPQ